MTPPIAGHTVDAHLHLWDLEAGDYPWLGPEHGPLYDTFTAESARAELDSAGIDTAVLVQADDSEDDTRFMLDAADRHRWIVGVVGWVQLDDPARAELQLDRWLRHPAFCGVRHLVHNDARADFLALPSVRASLRLLARRGLVFDVPDAWPHHLTATTELAAALPALRIVVDHLAKPPRGREDFDEWHRSMRALARQPGTVAKVSGLQLPDEPFTVQALRPVWDVALELFGPARLMYGGDWPMTVPTGGYQSTWPVMSELIGELSAAEQAMLMGGTAVATYRLREL